MTDDRPRYHLLHGVPCTPNESRCVCHNTTWHRCPWYAPGLLPSQRKPIPPLYGPPFSQDRAWLRNYSPNKGEWEIEVESDTETVSDGLGRKIIEKRQHHRTGQMIHHSRHRLTINEFEGEDTEMDERLTVYMHKKPDSLTVWEVQHIEGNDNPNARKAIDSLHNLIKRREWESSKKEVASGAAAHARALTDATVSLENSRDHVRLIEKRAKGRLRGSVISALSLLGFSALTILPLGLFLPITGMVLSAIMLIAMIATPEAEQKERGKLPQYKADVRKREADVSRLYLISPDEYKTGM